MVICKVLVKTANKEYFFFLRPSHHQPCSSKQTATNKQEQTRVNKQRSTIKSWAFQESHSNTFRIRTSRSFLLIPAPS